MGVQMIQGKLDLAGAAADRLAWLGEQELKTSVPDL